MTTAIVFINSNNQSKEQEKMPVNLNFNADLLGIGQAIANGIHANQNREGFVINLLNTAHFQLKQQYNVLICNLSQHPQDGMLNDVVLYGSGICDGVTFGIWGFTTGIFIHEGDGGYINWAMKGIFNRIGDGGKYVVFARPGMPLPDGNFAFSGSPELIHSNGQGHYCWFASMEDLARLNGGNTQYATMPGSLSDYPMTFDGKCGG